MIFSLSLGMGIEQVIECWRCWEFPLLSCESCDGLLFETFLSLCNF